VHSRAIDRSMTSRGGAGSERGDDESDGGVEERQHHTLTLSQGRALRRELSRHTLFGGGELAVESSPDTTLGTSEAEELARAFAIAANVGGGGGGARRGRASADGGRPMVTFDTVPEVIVESPAAAAAVETERGGSPNASDAMAGGGNGNVKSTTLTAASGRELAAELKKVQMQHSSSAAAQATRDATFSTTGSENVLEGKEEKTRRAIKTLQRQTDALMFLADAVEAKELPGLAARMRERLMSMKENYHDLMSYEGIRQRKKGAMKNARKYDLLRATFGHDDQNKQTMPTHGSDKPIEQRRKLKILAAKMLFAGVVFLVLLMIPFLVTQYEAQDQHVGCDSTTPGLVKLDHVSKGQLELTLLVGPCSYDDADYTLAYSIVQGDSAEYVLATTSGVSLPHESTSSSSHRRRKLLGGGGGGVSSHLKSSFSSFTLSDYDASHGDAYVKFTTDCPEPVAISMLAYDTGMVGTVGTWLGLVLLIVVFGLIITEIIHRTLVAFIGAAAVLFILALQHRLPTVADILTWMDHGTLALLFGMMIIVALLSRTGVFEFLSVRIVQAANGSMWRLFIMLMIFDAVLSAFLDNVTTMLLLAPVALSLCKALKIDPRPLLIPLSIFGNIGGCSTLIGDPPNIIIGNALKEYIGFVDFLRVLGPGVLLTMPFIFMFVKWYYGEALFGQKIKVDIDELKLKYPIRDWDLLIRSGTILGFVIVLFFLHPVMHMEPAYVAVFGAIAILLSGSHDEFEYALEKVEWDSLLFFAGLFVFTEGIAKLGLLREIADMLSTLIASFPIAKRQVGAMLLVQLVAGVASAFVDNIPFTTTMLPVIIQMADQVEGLSIEALAWALCFGADYGGIGTLIGSSANIVMAGISAEAGFPITFNSFFRIGWPVMCISLCISGAYLAALEAGGVFKV
jgi:Na+/H+ antiporter NhaD/arsenite permease-like protein